MARQFIYDFPRPALVMGILNVTPDSFSDGGLYADPSAAVDHALEMVGQGAEVIDVGGESTRPGAEPVEEGEELRRVLPVIERLVSKVTVPVSIDTMKPGVARAALDAGASLVNDVGANRQDGEMWELVAEFGAGYVCMHMSGTPRTMQERPAYGNVVEAVAAFFHERMAALAAHGVGAEQVVLDVGIGFGKTVKHNLQLIGALGTFTKLGRPMLLGASRKSFIGSLLDAETHSRLPGSLACAVLGVTAGVSLIRAHDVPETVQAVRMAEAIMATRE